jgi:hypothetical protein
MKVKKDYLGRGRESGETREKRQNTVMGREYDQNISMYENVTLKPITLYN